MPNRRLRPLGPTKWAVIIDTHEITPADADDAEVIDINGQRPLGDPVAVLVRVPGDCEGHESTSGPSGVSQTCDGSCVEAYDIYVYHPDTPRKIAEAVEGTPQQVAREIAEGDFDDDFRFEYYPNPEPSFPGDRYFITQYATPSQQRIDSFTTHDPGDVIASAREVQAIPLEERLDLYADRGW